MKDKTKCDQCWVSTWAKEEKRMKAVWNEKEGWQWEMPIQVGSITEIRFGTLSACQWRCPFDHVKVPDTKGNRACLSCPISQYIKDKRIKRWILGKDGWVIDEDVKGENEDDVNMMDEITVQMLIEDHCKKNCPFEIERFMQDGYNEEEAKL